VKTSERKKRIDADAAVVQRCAFRDGAGQTHSALIDAGGEEVWTCDPYGEPVAIIGTDDDAVFLSAIPLPTGEVYIASTLNSETGSFIMDFRPGSRVPAEDAEREAFNLTDQAITWCYENDLRRPDVVKPTEKFLRHVRYCAEVAVAASMVR
jgi:hypothetical protein